MESCCASFCFCIRRRHDWPWCLVVAPKENFCDKWCACHISRGKFTVHTVTPGRVCANIANQRKEDPEDPLVISRVLQMDRIGCSSTHASFPLRWRDRVLHRQKKRKAGLQLARPCQSSISAPRINSKYPPTSLSTMRLAGDLALMHQTARQTNLSQF